MTLHLVPVSFRDACRYVAEHHRHNVPPRGCKFVTAVADDDRLCGVAIVGRPISRVIAADETPTLEVLRTCTDGTRHANSMLYGAAWRAAQALGYRRLITYTQHDEPGTTLRAVGWHVIAQRPPRRGWDTPSRPRHNRGSDGIARTLWQIGELDLSDTPSGVSR